MLNDYLQSFDMIAVIITMTLVITAKAMLIHSNRSSDKIKASTIPESENRYRRTKIKAVMLPMLFITPGHFLITKMQLANHTEIINAMPTKSCKDGPCFLLSVISRSLLSGNNSIINPTKKIVVNINRDLVT